jgi:hypothetical protein
VHALAILAFSEDYARISTSVWFSKGKSDFSKDGDNTHELGFFKNSLNFLCNKQLNSRVLSECILSCSTEARYPRRLREGPAKP